MGCGHSLKAGMARDALHGGRHLVGQIAYTKNRRNVLQKKPITVYTTNRGDMLVTAEHQQRDCLNAAKAHNGLYNDK